MSLRRRSPVNGSDLRRIGGVEHIELRPARLGAEGFGENLGAETRSPHAQQDDVLEAARFHFGREVFQSLDVRELLLDDAERARPLVFVSSALQRQTAGPLPSNAAAFSPVFKFGFECRRHFWAVEADLLARVSERFRATAPSVLSKASANP